MTSPDTSDPVVNTERTFICEIDGRNSPIHTVEWFHNGKKMNIVEDYYKLTNDGETLKLLNLIKEDKGNYTCKVSGDTGTQKQYTLLVHCKYLRNIAIPTIDATFSLGLLMYISLNASWGTTSL